MTSPKARPPAGKAKRKAVKSKSRPDPLMQIAKFIESKGWRVIVIGPCRIQQPEGAREFHYEFVATFMGSKREVPRGKSS